MRAMNTLDVTYGTLRIKTRVVSFIDKPLGLKECCNDCGNNINSIKKCNSCNKEVEWAKVGKKIVVGKDEKILTKEQQDNLKTLSSEIKIIGASDELSISQSLIQASYLLLPQTKVKKKSEQNLIEGFKKDYAKLRESILQAGILNKAFLVEFSLRDRQKLGKLIVENNAIVLCVLAYPEYRKDNDEQDDLEIDLSEKDKKDSKKLATKVKKVDYDKVIDTYSEKVEQVMSGNTEPQDRENESEDSDMWGSL